VWLTWSKENHFESFQLFQVAVLRDPGNLKSLNSKRTLGPSFRPLADYSRVAPKVLRNESQAKSVSVRSEAFLFNTPYHTARVDKMKLVAVLRERCWKLLATHADRTFSGVTLNSGTVAAK
jgi:hypothetical protein